MSGVTGTWATATPAAPSNISPFRYKFITRWPMTLCCYCFPTAAISQGALPQVIAFVDNHILSLYCDELDHFRVKTSVWVKERRGLDNIASWVAEMKRDNENEAWPRWKSMSGSSIFCWGLGERTSALSSTHLSVHPLQPHFFSIELWNLLSNRENIKYQLFFFLISFCLVLWKLITQHLSFPSLCLGKSSRIVSPFPRTSGLTNGACVLRMRRIFDEVGSLNNLDSKKKKSRMAIVSQLNPARNTKRLKADNTITENVFGQ